MCLCALRAQIYGGGWVEGDSYEKGKFSGVKMAKEHNVVVVAVNYRLAALGFMALPALASANGQVGNVGLLDQRFLCNDRGLLLFFLFADGLVGRVLGPPKPLQQPFQDVRANR